MLLMHQHSLDHFQVSLYVFALSYTSFDFSLSCGDTAKSGYPIAPTITCFNMCFVIEYSCTLFHYMF